MSPTLPRLLTLAALGALVVLGALAQAGCDDPPVETTPVPDVEEKIQAVRSEVAEELKQAEARVVEGREDDDGADAGLRVDAD